MTLLLGWGNLWADTKTFTYSDGSASNNWTQSPITVNGTSGTINSNQLQFSTTGSSFTISTAVGKLTSAVITYTKNDDDRTGGGNSMTVADNNFITTGYSYDSSSHRGTWTASGEPTSVTFTAVSDKKIRIESIVVNYEAVVTHYTNLSIADFRFEHDYSGSDLDRSSIGGLKFTFSGGVKSYNSDIYTYQLLSDDGGSITVAIDDNAANSSKKITRLIFVGSYGSTTASGFSTTTGKDQLIWTGSESSVTLTTSGDRFTINQIYVETSAELTWSKQDVSLSFSPSSGSKETGLIDSQIDGVLLSTPTAFRIDSYNLTNSSSNASYNQYHLSQKHVGVDTGTNDGTATIKPIFNGSTYFNAVENPGTYTLTINGNTLKEIPKGTTVNLTRSGDSNQHVSKGDLIASRYVEVLSTADATKDDTHLGDGYLHLDGNADYVHIIVPANSKITVNAYSGAAKDNLYIGPATGGVTMAMTTEYADYVYDTTTGGDIYIKRVAGTTLRIASIKVENSNPLTTFAINLDDVRIYDNNSTNNPKDGTNVNSATFAYNSTYNTLRVKAYITPDYDNLTNPTFTVTSSDATVINASGVNVWKAGTERVYFDGLQVLAAGTTTLTFTFTGSDNYTGPKSFSQVFTVTGGSYDITYNSATDGTFSGPSSAEQGSVVDVTATPNAGKVFSALTIYKASDDSDVTSSCSVNGTQFTMPGYAVKVGGTFVDAPKYVITTAATTNGTVTVSPSGNQAEGTEMTITLTPNSGYQVNTVTVNGTDDESAVAVSGSGNTRTFTMPAKAVTVTATFKEQETAAVPYITPAALTTNTTISGPVTDGNTHTYTIINPSNKDQKVYVTAKAGTYVCIKHGSDLESLTDPSTSNKDKYIDATASEEDVNSGNAFAVSKNLTTYYIKAIAYTDKSGSHASEVQIFVFKTRATADAISAPTITADGTTYTGSSKSVTIATTATANTPQTYYKVGATVETDAAAIVSGGTMISGTSETITATQPSAESDIVVSVVTKDSNGDYSNIVTATYTYAGAKTWNVSANAITIQEGQRGYFTPVITDKDGNDIFGEEYEASDYFTFEYSYNNTIGADIDVSNATKTDASGFDGVAEDGGIKTKRETDGSDNYVPTYVGQKATVHITATRNATALPAGITLDGSEKSGTATATIITYTKGYGFDLYWDEALSNKITDTYYTEDKTGDNDFDAVFNNFPNGRVIYVAPKVATDEIWFTHHTEFGTGISYPENGKVTYGKHLYQYRRGIPVHVDGTSGTLYVSIQAMTPKTTTNAKGKTVRDGDPSGSIMNLKFIIADHTRPAAPTYDPTTAGSNLSTSISVAAKGTAGNTPQNQVYAKFTGKYTNDEGTTGTRTNYTIEGLVNEENVIYGLEQAAVFSTEVNKRVIEGVQYQWYDDVATTKTDDSAVTYPAGWYVSKTNENNYFYLYTSTMTLSDKAFYVNIDNGTAENYADFEKPTFTLTYYNKDEAKDIDIKDSEVAANRITYSVQNYNGANVSINSSNGDVTISNKSGYAVVTVEYTGGYAATVNGRPSTAASTKATYTIYITNSAEEVPTITPTSRSFVDEQSVTVTAPDHWNALYMIQEYNNSDEYNPTFAESVTYTSSGESKNCYLLEAGKSATFTITDSRKVRAFAFDPNAYTEGSGATPSVANTSKEVTETYTKLAPLAPPTLDPSGDPHERHVPTLSVSAIPPEAGVEVYFTTDGTDPTIESEKYDGNKKINISGAATTVKAIAYDPATGRISTVTTGVYIYTTDIEPPVFHVTGTGAGDYTSGEVTIDGSSVITLTGPDGATIYYTLDGSTPTSTTAQRYNASFNLVKTTTGKAIAVDGDASSTVTTVTFILKNESTLKELWEAVEETTPSGKMPNNDRYVSLDKKAAGSTSSTLAVKYLTATFSGMDNDQWKNTSIGEKTQGTPLDGVGTYSIRNSKDAADEEGNEVANNGTLLHNKTFQLPAQGDFVRFEPERDGRLTIWLLQQGGLHYTDDGDFCNGFIRLRPVYMFDERGNSIEAVSGSIKSAARLSNNWDDLDVSETEVATGRYGNWIAKGSKQNGATNKFYTETESEAIYNMYKTNLGEKGAGSAIAPFEIPDGDVKTYLEGQGLSGHGYVMPSGGFVKYSFDLKGGKSYYFFGYRTKLGIRGFQFKATAENVAKSVMIEDNATNLVDAMKDNNNIAENEICDVTYKRGFTSGKWAGIVLPFSVSRTQMQQVFGENVDVVHFDRVENNTIELRRHWYPMIVAGTPVFILPSQDVAKETGAQFKAVRLEPSVEVVEMTDSKGGSNYRMTGSFTSGTISTGDYYISGGALAYRSSASVSTNAGRAWLHTTGAAKSGMLIGTSSVWDTDDWDVWGNPQPSVDDNSGDMTTYIDGIREDGIFGKNEPTDIYTINGQLVRRQATTTQGLPKGIYIAHGKKFVVK